MVGVGDAATLFGVPGSLVNYNQAGSSLTYENTESVYQAYWRETLKSTYASRIEATLSAVLRTVVAFDPTDLFLASMQDRAQAASVLANSGYDRTQAGEAVGLPPIPSQPETVEVS